MKKYIQSILKNKTFLTFSVCLGAIGLFSAAPSTKVEQNTQESFKEFLERIKKFVKNHKLLSKLLEAKSFVALLEKMFKNSEQETEEFLTTVYDFINLLETLLSTYSSAKKELVEAVKMVQALHKGDTVKPVSADSTLEAVYLFKNALRKRIEFVFVLNKLIRHLNQPISKKLPLENFVPSEVLKPKEGSTSTYSNVENVIEQLKKALKEGKLDNSGVETLASYEAGYRILLGIKEVSSFDDF